MRGMSLREGEKGCPSEAPRTDASHQRKAGKNLRISRQKLLGFRNFLKENGENGDSGFMVGKTLTIDAISVPIVRQSARQCTRPARALKILVAASFIHVSVSRAAPMRYVRSGSPHPYRPRGLTHSTARGDCHGVVPPDSVLCYSC